jgi:F-type H+-transporting ATPase subunit alpha
VLSSTLFAGGQRPAIDASLSVSRVGGKAQPEVVRSLAGRLRLDYASFLSLEVFSKLGTRLDPAAERRMAVGRRVRQLLRAPRGKPLSLFALVVRLLFASEEELLLRVPESEVGALAATLERHLLARFGAEAEQLERDGTLSHETREALAQEIATLVGELKPEGADDSEEPQPKRGGDPQPEREDEPQPEREEKDEDEGDGAARL